MITYVVTFVLAWAVYKLVAQILGMRAKRRLFHTLPDMDGRHWFFGYVHRMNNLDDLIKLVQNYVTRATPELFTTWMMFFFPVLNPMHPRTLKTVLNAQNVPKNVGPAGPYRMLKPWLGDGLLISQGKKWERNRRLLTPAFHFEILRSYVDVFNRVSDVFLNRIQEAAGGGKSFDVYPMVGRATLDVMLRCTLSYEDDSVQNSVTHHPYVAAVSRISKLLTDRTLNPFLFPDVIYDLTSNGRKMKKELDFVHTFATDIIEARKKTLGEDSTKLQRKHLDFLDTLLTAKDEEGQGLTDLEIRAEVDTFMFAGHDTTASAISWALYALATHPDMQEKVRQEANAVFNGRQHLHIDDLSHIPYTTYFIKEVLRFYSPVPLSQRRLVDPLAVQGIKFQPGQQIDLYHYVIHHNPALWEEPEEFRPERFLPDNIVKKDPFAFIPFSAGHRNCIGQNFAMNEIKIILTKMVHRFRIIADPDKVAVIYPEIVTRPKDGIFLKFEAV